VHIRLSSVLFGILIPDLALTCVAAAAERQPRLLLFVPFYPVMRLVDAAIGLSAIPVAWLTRANGRWRSPARRAVSPAAAPGPRSIPGRTGRSGTAAIQAARAFAGEGAHASG
jgi:hypothetical protein